MSDVALIVTRTHTSSRDTWINEIVRIFGNTRKDVPGWKIGQKSTLLDVKRAQARGRKPFLAIVISVRGPEYFTRLSQTNQ